MKTLSGPTLTHLQGETTTFAAFWKITRRDGTVKGFTSHVRDVVYSGVTYKAASGVFPTNIQSSTGKGVDNLSIFGVVNSPDITEQDLMNGLYDDAQVEVFLHNYADLTQTPIVMVTGYVGEVKLGRKAFEAEVRSLIQRAQQFIGKTCSPLCRAKQLGDAECGVSLGPYTFTGTVQAVTSLSQFHTNSAGIVGKPFGYFAYGTLEFTSGPNTGRVVEVRTHNTSSPMLITLAEPLSFTPGIGDSFEIIAGCDRTFSTCKNKFGNVLRFRGEPYIPGTDFVLRKTSVSSGGGGGGKK